MRGMLAVACLLVCTLVSAAAASLSLKRNVAVAVTGLGIFFSPVPFEQQNVVLADSTGKMSTKLSARRRYLPRINEGVYAFNNMAKDPSSAESSVFLSNDEKSGKRKKFTSAMNLYGASLRKGETLDEISREAERLTTAFSDDLATIEKSRKREDVAKAKVDLDKYLDFVKLPTSSAPEYNTLPSK